MRCRPRLINDSAWLLELGRIATKLTELVQAAEGFRIMSACPRIEIRARTKTYRRETGDLVRPVDNIDMVVDDDEIVVLLGPSGCGKTTLLRCVAGLERPDSGEILINGQVVFSPGTRSPAAGEAPDQHDLPVLARFGRTLTVVRHVSCRSRLLGVCGKREMAPGAQAILDVAGVGGLGGQYPGRISGGRTAAGRACACTRLGFSSTSLCFDEPLSNVDTPGSSRLHSSRGKLQAGKIGFSALYVTHDQSEALELGHQVAVLDSGRVADVGAPERQLRRPSQPVSPTSWVSWRIFSPSPSQATKKARSEPTANGSLQIDIDAGSSWKAGMPLE